jgi:hypothetical protein
MRKPSSRDLTREATKAIRLMLGTTSADDDARHRAALDSEWLPILYHRFRSDAQQCNDRVYEATKIYLPLSLTPLAALVITMKDPRVVDVVLMGIASLALAVVSILIGHREQSVRNGYNAVMVAIQDELNLPTEFLARPAGVSTSRIRIGFLVGLAMAWIVVLIAVATGVFARAS